MKIWPKECDHYDYCDGDGDGDVDGDDDGDDVSTLCDDGKEKNTDQHH